jgi:hypothetical protein
MKKLVFPCHPSSIFHFSNGKAYRSSWAELMLRKMNQVEPLNTLKATVISLPLSKNPFFSTLAANHCPFTPSIHYKIKA